MEAMYSVPLTSLIEEFSLQVLYQPDGIGNIHVCTDDINRCGLQLTGFFDHFESDRIQIVGNVEATFLQTFSSEKRREAFERLLSTGIPAILFARQIEPCPECLEVAKIWGVPVLRSGEPTGHIMSSMIASLKVSLAPRITRHGVLVEVYGEGLLLLGESGVGKSETAIELVKRGHRLIADDAVEIKKVSAKTLVGSAPELIRHYIELRGIGVVDVRRIFGMGAVKPTEKIDLIVNIELWKDAAQYDRLGLDSQTTSILDVEIPSLVIPVKPGRNLAVILEVAAMNNRQKKLGFNSANDFTNRINLHFAQAEAAMAADKERTHLE